MGGEKLWGYLCCRAGAPMRASKLPYCVFAAVEQQAGGGQAQMDGGWATVLGGLRGAGAQEGDLCQLPASLR